GRIHWFSFTMCELSGYSFSARKRKSQIQMTRHCHNCGEAWTISGQPGRGEVCMKCRADLRVCLNCTYYDPRAANAVPNRFWKKPSAISASILILSAATGRQKMN